MQGQPLPRAVVAGNRAPHTASKTQRGARNAVRLWIEESQNEAPGYSSRAVENKVARSRLRRFSFLRSLMDLPLRFFSEPFWGVFAGI
jgi:hypothetical protein